MDLVSEGTAVLRHLADVDGPALSAALGFHLARRAARARAWQNVVRAAYPAARLGFPTAFGACVAAVGLSSLSPIRGGELARIVVVKPRVAGSSYATLAGTLVVETLVDVAVAGSLVVVTFAAGLVPGLGGLAVLGLSRRSLAELGARVRNGVAVLGDRRAFARGVVSWLGLSWALRITSVYFFLVAFSIDATPGTALVVVAVQCLSTLVPLTWAGIGAQQGLLVAVLASTAGAGGAVAFGVGMQAATLLLNVGAGIVALAVLVRTLRWRSLAAALRLT